MRSTVGDCDFDCGVVGAGVLAMVILAIERWRATIQKENRRLSVYKLVMCCEGGAV